MTYYGNHPRLRRTTEPVDISVWRWFICNGPNGERFSWHRNSPHPKRDITLLAEFMEERESAHPGFLEKARLIATEALASPDPVIALTGIQVLTVEGTEADLVAIRALTVHPDERVAKNARAALFERGVRMKTHKT